MSVVFGSTVWVRIGDGRGYKGQNFKKGASAQSFLSGIIS
jgi:hypothetical protein